MLSSQLQEQSVPSTELPTGSPALKDVVVTPVPQIYLAFVWHPENAHPARVSWGPPALRVTKFAAFLQQKSKLGGGHSSCGQNRL